MIGPTEWPKWNVSSWHLRRLEAVWTTEWPEVFGGGWGQRVTTEDELGGALARARTSNEVPALIEIMLDRFDTSEALKRLGAELSPDRGPPLRRPFEDAAQKTREPLRD